MFNFRHDNRRSVYLALFAAVGMTLLGGCTFHPRGEQEERHAVHEAGRPFEKHTNARVIPPLPDAPSADDLVRHALLSNADLEQKYWEWRSAVEQIPQDGTQSTNLALSASLNLSRGSTGLGSATLGAGNDPMADIVLPPKLSVAARRALENARAAGIRFRKAQFNLRAQVLNAYFDYALTAELTRLEQSNIELLKTTSFITEARNSSGNAGQQDVLKARNEMDLAKNDVANMQAQLLAQRAVLNALMDCPTEGIIPVPAALPMNKKFIFSNEELLHLAATQNPEIIAQAREIAAKHQGIELAKLQYLPDISIGINSDLKGVAQSLVGMVTVPWLRYEAIDAAIAQAESNLRASEAMQRQTHNNLLAQVVMNISTIRDADRQLELFDATLVPRVTQMVTLARSAFESGHSSLLDLLDSQRSLISIRRLVANFRILREKRAADLEAVIARPLL